MSDAMRAQLNTILLAFISVMVPAFAALVWKFYGGLPEAVNQIRQDVSDIKGQQGRLAEMQDQRFRHIEKDLDRIEAKVR